MQYIYCECKGPNITALTDINIPLLLKVSIVSHIHVSIATSYTFQVSLLQWNKITVGLHCMFCKILLCPGRGAAYCDQLVCLSASISLDLQDRYAQNFVCRSHGRGSVLPQRHCATLCTSGFVDDVMFGQSRPYQRARTQHREV